MVAARVPWRSRTIIITGYRGCSSAWRCVTAGALIRNFSMQAKTGACRTTKAFAIALGARFSALCVAVWTCAHVMSEAVQGSNTANRRLFDAAANPPPGAVDADALEA